MRIVKDLEILAIEWETAGNQSVQDDAKTPNIHFRSVIFLSLEKFGGGIGRAPTEGVQLVACNFENFIRRRGRKNTK